MYERYPDSYQIIIGYANILSNLGYFDDAMELYTKAIEIRPHLIAPYVYTSYIYEYKRIEPKKSI